MSRSRFIRAVLAVSIALLAGSHVVTPRTVRAAGGMLRPELNWGRSLESAGSVATSPTLGGAVAAGLALPIDSSQTVWDNGTNTPSANKSAVPLGVEWASWPQYGSTGQSRCSPAATSQTRHFRATFLLPGGASPSSYISGVILADPHYAQFGNVIPINDNLYAFINGHQVLTGGTNYGASNAGMNGTAAFANETDGWYVSNGSLSAAAVADLQPGQNTLDIVTEERACWGGMGRLDLTLVFSGVVDFKQWYPYSDVNQVTCPTNLGGWACSYLHHGSNNSDPYNCWSMARGGCAVTAVADVLAYYGHTINGVPIDPGTLNDWLSQQPTTFSGCGLRWIFPAPLDDFAVDGPLFPDKVSWLNRRTAINNALAADEPPIVTVGPTGTYANAYGLHFVVVVGNNGTPTDPDYVIIDPNQSSSPIALSQSIYGTVSDLVSRGYFEAVVIHRPAIPVTVTSAIGMVGHSPIELLVTDPSGNQTGYDATTGTYLGAIPSSTYGVDYGVSNDQTGAPLQPPTVYFKQEDPTPGDYSLRVIGTGDGPYHIDIGIVDAVGFSHVQSIDGTASTGSLDTYSVNVPSPASVGGIAEAPELVKLPAHSTPSGGGTTQYLIGGSIALALLSMAGASAWYVRRRRAV